VPWGEPEPTDPNVLVGVELPAGVDATREMAWIFAEEFARLGFDGPGMLSVFRSPFYAAAHRALQLLGETEVISIVEECVAVFGRHASRDTTEGD
jgi:hypothetical protein